MQIGAGTVAVITGGASGIGRACANEFARRGADVVIADVNDDRLAEAETELKGFGVRTLALHCDVADDASVTNLKDAALAALGHVDLIMNNAGTALLGPPDRVPLDDWHRLFEINVFGLIRGTQAFVPHFLERGSGYVVNTASIAGLYAYSWDSVPYISSKFSAYGLSEGLYIYLKPQGIGVSVLCPGLVLTNLGETAKVAGLEERNGWGYFPPDMRPIEAGEVGTLVAEAVEADQFLILTHPEDQERLVRRRADIEGELRAQVAAAPTPPRLP